MGPTKIDLPPDAPLVKVERVAARRRQRTELANGRTARAVYHAGRVELTLPSYLTTRKGDASYKLAITFGIDEMRDLLAAVDDVLLEHEKAMRPPTPRTTALGQFALEQEQDGPAGQAPVNGAKVRERRGI